MSHIRPILKYAMVVATTFTAISCSIFSLDVENPEEILQRTLVSDGRMRSYIVYNPPDREGALPLVIVFHGFGGNGDGIRLHTQFDVVARQFGFRVAYPDAYSDWAEGCDCSQADLDGVDDVLFTSDLIDAVDEELGVDRTRVFATGFSQGGLMAYKLACDLSDELAGVAAVAASMAVPLAEYCSPAEAIPLMVLLGTEDTRFPWEGAYDRGVESMMSADSTMRFWAAANGCGSGDRVVELEYTGESSAIEVWRESYAGCPIHAQVVLYRLEGAGHIWPQQGFPASWNIAEFFRLD